MGFRAIAFKSCGKVQLRSRNDNNFTTRYRHVSASLASMPDDTVIDGEIVALDEDGRPSFNLLQNFGSGAQIVYCVFDVMVLGGRNVMSETLESRRRLLEQHVLSVLDEPVR